MKSLFSFLFFALFPIGTVYSEDWPMYRADAKRSASIAESIPNRLTLRWTHRSKHSPRSAWPTSKRIDFDLVFHPIIVGDLVLFGSSVDDQLYAIDAASGDTKWAFFTGAPIRFAPCAWEDRVFVASDDGWIYAVSLNDGALLWKFRGGPDDSKVLGNERMISKWPARGGPVVLDDTVYFSAGIWPSDGVYLHALDADSGKPVWSNGETGRIFMDQPHGGAQAESGVSAQGYLVATGNQLLVPTGRAVPAIFNRGTGQLQHYHLQKNQQRGGSRVMAADQFLLNAGCLFDLGSGELNSQIGLGPVVAVSNGIVQATSRSLKASKWQDAQVIDRKGAEQKVRQLKENRLVTVEEEILDFIVAGGDAICGEDGRVSVIDYAGQRTVWWSHEVEGKALGLAAGNGRLVVSTDRGVVYCFDGGPESLDKNTAAAETPQTKPGKEALAAADEILAKSNLREGFCVDLGAGTGELAHALAEKSDLHIYAVESDPEKVALARKKLSDAGLYGSRVTLVEADPAETGFPKYFANLVVSSQSLSGVISKPIIEEMQRIQRPFGGKMVSGSLTEMQVEERGALEGSGSWTHQNSSAANTLCSDDSALKGPLSMFWFRDVDFEIPNRHGQGPAPLVNQGCMVVGGVDGIACLDAYNGRTLWVFELKDNLTDYDGIHHDVGVGATGSNFCLSDEAVFLKNADRCFRIDLLTGEVLGEFKTPAREGEGNRNWGFLAHQNGILFGSIEDQSHQVSPRYKLTKLRTQSTRFFAMDDKSGEVKWQFDPKHSIRNNAIAIADDKVFLIDRALVDADNVPNPKRNGKHVKKLPADDIPGGILLALNSESGKELWRNDKEIFGTQLAASETHSTLMMNYEAVRHNFFALPSETGGRLAGFDLKTGKPRWDHAATYQTRPIINDYTIYAQGGAWNLITGEEVPFEFERSYGCGQISSSKNLMLFRSATLGYKDLSRDAGTENYGGIRPSCWINAIPANGLVLVPDGSSKCVCSYQMRAWFALQSEGN
ncbi:PQQ-binding-like beta-propeller repeat protein [Verrucomicrobiales bacterium]|nr:PQQ-binding-like beta-propeller repeat protein [Verrucomicrobiales bacterium]MDA7926762.1 PQQ-binding-like beta-propeller repeat protein [Verrucomicrobiales bacterium]